MSTFDREDLLFQLFEVAKLEQHLELCDVDLDRTAVEGVLETAAKVAAEKIAPIAHFVDEHEPKFIEGEIILPEGLSEAVNAYLETGLGSANFPEEYGGIDIPYSVVGAADFIIKTADCTVFAYSSLTSGAADLIASFGNQEQKNTYLPKMVSGEWFGTMALSEPLAGSSLADIKTKAELQDDGRYKITGDKMWISGGDHPLRENIVHLLLAKIPGGPPGVKGISLFIVPKVRPDGDGNNVEVTGLNHKMGQRGLVNCALSFGASGDCFGELVGEPHQGLSCMFQMMNQARVHVGTGAIACAQAGYQASLSYAKERPQGRHPDQKDPLTAQVMLVEHADVRRLLLAQKTTVEAGLALSIYCSTLIDIQSRASASDERNRAGTLLEVLTPIMKSWSSEFGLEANKHAIQVLGGAGYTRDYPVERYYRDNRLNHIHEGTHGIHGIDLLGRKMPMRKGAVFALLNETILADVEEARACGVDESFIVDMKTAQQSLATTTQTLLSKMQANPRRGLANATLYLDFTGHIVMAWMWLRILIAAKKKAQRYGESDFIRGKFQAAQYFYKRELVRTEGWAKTLQTNDQSAFDMPVAGL